ncbi:MAG: (d)CMP kinase [Pseudomonadota bacterium]
MARKKAEAKPVDGVAAPAGPSFTVAIDGPAGAGKGTVARGLAAQYGFAHLDTGLLYRAVGKLAMDTGRGVIDEGAAELIARDLRPEHVTIPGLRSALAARAASRVAKFPGVRKALIAFQRDFARRPGGAVLDGRDIGTVICPDAEVKLFLIASAEARAERRYQELIAAGAETSRGRVLAEIRARDTQDAERESAPMRQAPDAHLIDTTDLDIEAAVATAAALIDRARAAARP